MAYEMRISDWSSDVCSSDRRVLPLLGFPVTLFGSAKRRWENVRRQAQLDHVIAVVKHKTIRDTAVCANNTPCNLNVEHLAAGRAGDDDARSEESRVGKGCVSRGRSRWSPSQ